MRPELQNQFAHYERQRTAIGNNALSLSTTQLNWVPTPNDWSIRQIIHPIVLGDEAAG